MSNLIPPLVSSTPPPIGSLDDDDDEFGDFTTAVECSYNCDIPSIPSTPSDTPRKEPFRPVDINSNRSSANEKDFQDRRKIAGDDADENGVPKSEEAPKMLDTVENERNKLGEDRNVPSYISPGDVFHEEPPEIDLSDVDDDFGDFEFGPSGLDLVDDVPELPPIESSELPAFGSPDLSPAIENSKLPVVESSELPTTESSKLPKVESSELTVVESPELTGFAGSELPAFQSSKLTATQPTVASSKFKDIESQETTAIELPSFKSPKLTTVENSELPTVESSAFGSFESSAIESSELPAFKSPTAKNSELPTFESSKSFELPTIESSELPSFNSPTIENSELPTVESSVFGSFESSVIKSSEFKSPTIKNSELPLVERFGQTANEGFKSDTIESTGFRSPKLTTFENSEVPTVESSELTAFGSFVSTAIELPTNENSKLTAGKDSKVSAAESSSLTTIPSFASTAIENSKLTTIKDSEISAVESSKLTATSSLEATAIESSKLSSFKGSKVTTNENSELPSLESSDLTAVDSTAFESSKITTLKNSELSSLQGSELTVIESSAFESSAFESSKLTTEKSIVEASELTASKNSAIEPIASPAIESSELSSSIEESEPKQSINDDFGDFADFKSTPEFATTFEQSSSSFPSNAKDILEQTESIVEQMFKVESDKCEAEFKLQDLVVGDGVFRELRDITDTNALSYQWGKSRTQQSLLKSLNIDTRNILYGPGSSTMPKFAANLGLAPLEPVRSGAPTSTEQTSVAPSSNGTTPADIPVAQFDWNESGLANPLDSNSKEELPPNRTEVETTQKPERPAQSDYVPETPKTYDTESVNSLQFSDITVELDERKPSDEDEDDDFSDFASFQESGQPWSTGNMVPLRESHIASSAEVKRSDVDEPGWLKPTILTPVLRRKDEKHDDDDFSDFQMSIPPKVEEVKAVEVELPGFAKEAEILQPSVSNTPILKPVQSDANSSAVQINWPDPGITEEELSRFEMYSAKTEAKKSDSPPERKLSGNTGLMLVEKSVVVPANKVVLPSKEVLLPPNDKVVISKDLVLPILESSPRKYAPLKSAKSDDDDWTEFVSVPRTPELSLSVPRLSHVQPPKLPIPVITPAGLMQTKIPSSVAFAGNCQHKASPQTPLHVGPPQDGYQPSIISQQYAVQFNQNSFQGLYQTTSIPTYVNGTSQLDDADEWSDFVSSRPQTRRPAPSISTLPELDFAAPKTRAAAFHKK